MTMDILLEQIARTCLHHIQETRIEYLEGDMLLHRVGTLAP